jgi:hypothetical protein
MSEVEHATVESLCGSFGAREDADEAAYSGTGVVRVSTTARHELFDAEFQDQLEGMIG